MASAGLGKPRPHAKKAIRERREQILLLMSRGYSQGDISRELSVTRQTISSDMRYINQITNNGLFVSTDGNNQNISNTGHSGRRQSKSKKLIGPR